MVVKMGQAMELGMGVSYNIDRKRDEVALTSLEVRKFFEHDLRREWLRTSNENAFYPIPPVFACSRSCENQQTTSIDVQVADCVLWLVRQPMGFGISRICRHVTF